MLLKLNLENSFKMKKKSGGGGCVRGRLKGVVFLPQGE